MHEKNQLKRISAESQIIADNIHQPKFDTERISDPFIRKYINSFRNKNSEAAFQMMQDFDLDIYSHYSSDGKFMITILDSETEKGKRSRMLSNRVPKSHPTLYGNFLVSYFRGIFGESNCQ